MTAATLTSRSQRKPKGEGHARRAEILAAAERIFVGHGYEGATIRKIAQEVGLSSTALYMHFADKGEILREICRGAFEALMGANAAVLAETTDAEARLRLMLERYVAFGFENPNAYRLAYMTRPLEMQAGLEQPARELGQDLYRSFEQVVEDLAAAGRLKAPSKQAAQAMWAGAHGVVSLMITKPYFDWVGRDELVKTLVDGLFSGFLKP